jgi:DNA-binding FadR family transcriptional regulator
MRAAHHPEAFVSTTLHPIHVPTLKGEVVHQIESLILSGELSPGDKLPPERTLARELGVSRPVVHAGIVDLQQKGLVRIEPRHGCFVNDYRLSGSAELLSSLWRHKGEELEPAIVESMMEFRVAVEQEAAARAARAVARGEASVVGELEVILQEGDACDAGDAGALAENDYRFHFTVALLSGNLVYPMLMNTFRDMYLSLLERFFGTPGVVRQVRAFRRSLVAAIAAGDEDSARQIMRKLSEVRSYA